MTIPKLRSVRARALSVPINRPLPVATGAVTHSPLVLIDLETEDSRICMAGLLDRARGR